jgi:transposase
MSRKRYTKEFKLEAVKLSESIGINKASQELGVTAKSLRTWSNREPSDRSSKTGSSKNLSDLEAELREVKKENKRLKQINEVLKKSTAIFSKDHFGDLK